MKIFNTLVIASLFTAAMAGTLRAGQRVERKAMDFEITVVDKDGTEDITVHETEGTNPSDPEVVAGDNVKYDDCPNPFAVQISATQPIGGVCGQSSDCDSGCCLIPRCVCGEYNSDVPSETCVDDTSIVTP